MAGEKTKTGEQGAKTSINPADPANRLKVFSAAKTGPDRLVSETDRRLLEACKKGDFAAAKEALEKGADPNARDENGRTPLMNAAYTAQLMLVKLLIAKGAEANDEKEKRGMTVLDAAVQARMEADIRSKEEIGDAEKIVELLQEHGAKEITNLNSYLHFLYFYATASVKDLEWLIKLGADVNQADKDGNTMLMKLAINLKAEPIELLLKHGADPTAKNKNGETALSSANEGYKDNLAYARENGDMAYEKRASDAHAKIVRLLTFH